MQKSVRDLLEISKSGKDTEGKALPKLTQEQKEMRILLMEQEMRMAAAELDFERAAKLRDGIIALREGKEGEPAPTKSRADSAEEANAGERPHRNKRRQTA